MSETTYVNPGVQVGIMPLYPSGTNSTMFTECCRVAICDWERCCPRCGREVVGCDIEGSHARHMYRWKLAYKF
jgi:hypothetical protein